jgi:PAS domain S-box-containing protein
VPDGSGHCWHPGVVDAVNMTFQYVPWVIPIVVAAALSCGLATLAGLRRAMPLARAFTVMMAGETVWALAAALEPIIVELPLKRLCIDFRLFGTFIAILGLVAFVLRYTGLGSWLRASRFGVLCAMAVPLIVLEWTDPWHHLYWARLSNEPIDGVEIAIRSFGPGFWATITYAYVLAAFSTVLLVLAVIRLGGLYRAQAALMLFGVLLPWLVDIADMNKLLGFIPVDLVSTSFAVTGLTFMPALFRFRLLDLTPVAWAAVVKLMDDPVVVMDALARCVALNPAAQRLIGKPETTVLGVEATTVFDVWPALANRLRTLRENPDESFEIDRPGPDEVLVYSARLSRLGPDEDSSGWVLVLRDITEIQSARREKAEMRSVQKAFAESAAANRAKDRFIATLSHELRTPLTPVLSTVSAMLDDPSTLSSMRSVLEMIRRNTALEARLIDDLLDLTRIEQGKLHLIRELIDAHEQIDRVLEICGDDAHTASVTLVSQLKAESHHVDADPARFQQVLWNLLKNAIKFTPPGETITIRSENRAEAEGEGGRPRLVIQITDRGVGIEPELLETIFDPFEQGGPASQQRFGGLGLGLSISRSIALQHGGSLNAFSQGKGTGSTFTLEFPTVASPVLPTAAPTQLPELALDHRPLRILLVEDNKDTLKYLSESLRGQGHLVRTAGDLAQALRIVAESDFEMLISDIDLPDGSGLDLMWKLRSRGEVMGIAVSGFGTLEDISLSHSAGFARHLTKPFEFRRLEEAIRQVAAGSRSESD